MVDIKGHTRSVAGFSFGHYKDWCLNLNPGHWYSMKISIRGNHVVLSLNGSILREEEVNYPTNQFQIKLWGARVFLTSIDVVPIN